MQVERRKKENLAEKQKIRTSIDHMNRELHELEEERIEMRAQEDSLRRLDGGHGEGFSGRTYSTAGTQKSRYRQPESV